MFSYSRMHIYECLPIYEHIMYITELHTDIYIYNDIYVFFALPKLTKNRIICSSKLQNLTPKNGQ